MKLGHSGSRNSLLYYIETEAQKDEVIFPKVSQRVEAKAKMILLPHLGRFSPSVQEQGRWAHFPRGNVECQSWSSNPLLTDGETEDQRKEGTEPFGQAWLHSRQLSQTLKGKMISIYAESAVRDVGLFFGISSPMMRGKT